MSSQPSFSPSGVCATRYVHNVGLRQRSTRGESDCSHLADGSVKAAENTSVAAFTLVSLELSVKVKQQTNPCSSLRATSRRCVFHLWRREATEEGTGSVSLHWLTERRRRREFCGGLGGSARPGRKRRMCGCCFLSHSCRRSEGTCFDISPALREALCWSMSRCAASPAIHQTQEPVSDGPQRAAEPL